MPDHIEQFRELLIDLQNGLSGMGEENQKGISYDKLFASYIKDAEKITITDAYIRIFYQIRNLMEFIEMVIKHKPIEDEVQIPRDTT